MSQGNVEARAGDVSEVGISPARLVYGIDRQLRDGDTLLVGFHEHGPWGCIAVDSHRYEIVRQEHRGWRFQLVDLNTGDEACEFVPFRVGRSGRILGGEAPVTLRGVPLRPRRWKFVSDAGWQVDAEVVDFRSKRAGSHEARKPRSHFEVQLRHLQSRFASPGISLVLAFGCWILVERASIKVPDYGR